MKRSSLAAILLILLSPLESRGMSFDLLLSDEELTDSGALTKVQIQRFLDERGTLGGRQEIDTDELTKPVADIIARVSFSYQINPKFLLVLLQKEQSLIEDPTPSQDQIDWAAGYAVCDSCRKSDYRVIPFRGLARQLEAAAAQVRGGYLAELEQFGITPSGFGPGIPKIVDGLTIVPTNKATAALYSYTPHLRGNRNFYEIWRRWFGVRYPDGSLLQVRGEPGVWLIHFGKRRPFLSKSALTSRFDIDNLITVSKQDLENYEIGSSIKFVNYSLLNSPDGSMYLLVDDVLRLIGTETFRAIGFSPDELVAVTEPEIEGYEIGPPLTLAESHPLGEVLEDRQTKKVYYVSDNQKQEILSPETLSDRFPGVEPRKVDGIELSQLILGDPLRFRNGALVKMKGQPAVYLISNGARKLIPTETIFHSFGWKFANVIETTPEALLVHPQGNDLTRPNDLIISSF